MVSNIFFLKMFIPILRGTDPNWLFEYSWDGLKPPTIENVHQWWFFDGSFCVTSSSWRLHFWWRILRLDTKENWVVVSNIFYVHPGNWGRWTHVDEHIFQMGLVQPPTRKGSDTFQRTYTDPTLWETENHGLKKRLFKGDVIVPGRYH